MTKCNSGKNKNGLWLNLTKTEYMECGPQSVGSISVDGQDLKKMDCFKYLGSTLLVGGNSLPDACLCANTACLKWHQVMGFLCDLRLPIHLKTKIYKTVMWPVALYGSCWLASTKHQQALYTMEHMRMLQWWLGLTRLDQVMNEDVQKVLDKGSTSPLVQPCRSQRRRISCQMSIAP